MGQNFCKYCQLKSTAALIIEQKFSTSHTVVCTVHIDQETFKHVVAFYVLKWTVWYIVGVKGRGEGSEPAILEINGKGSISERWRVWKKVSML